ncbi:hypothetical protein [Actinoalloteichus caeruleus]|uniref:hypothetical protein n=1 Tax=Actinoalloteichus cyanogriseus TaxID=2893586 RepID=UPI0004AB7497|nr:hypothetical protein [Actinoalloteichus caeruleus]
MTNPLIAPDYSGGDKLDAVVMVEAAGDAVTAVQNGDWLEAGVNIGAAGLDALAVVADPFGTLLTSAFAWFIEHVPPLPDMLNCLAGNPDVVHTNAATWGNVADSLGQSSQDMGDIVRADTEGWEGPAVEAYRPVAMGQAAAIQAASIAANGVGVALTAGATVVSVVRTIVRDLIAEAMSELVQWLIRAAAAAGLTLGLATPVLVADGIRLVMKWANKVQDWIQKAVLSITGLSKHVAKLGDVLTDVAQTLAIAVPKNLAVYSTQVDDKPFATGESSA